MVELKINRSHFRIIFAVTKLLSLAITVVLAVLAIFLLFNWNSNADVFILLSARFPLSELKTTAIMLLCATIVGAICSGSLYFNKINRFFVVVDVMLKLGVTCYLAYFYPIVPYIYIFLGAASLYTASATVVVAAETDDFDLEGTQEQEPEIE